MYGGDLVGDDGCGWGDGCDGGGRVVMVMAVLEMVGVMVNWCDVSGYVGGYCSTYVGYCVY